MSTVQQIRAVAEEACRYALANIGEFPKACVNWGDFGVTEVASKTVVILEEADPRNEELIAFVYQRLKEAGIDTENVEVVTEW